MNKRTLWTIIIIVVVILLGVLVYASSHKTTTTDSTASSTAVDPDGDGDMHDADTATTTDTNASTTVNAGISAGVTTGTTKNFTVEGSNFKFVPATLSVKKGDSVKIVFKNTGGFHDFVLDGYNVRTKQIAGGAEAEVTFVASKAGTFEYYCSVGNHRAMGMKGTLTVSE